MLRNQYGQEWAKKWLELNNSNMVELQKYFLEKHGLKYFVRRLLTPSDTMGISERQGKRIKVKLKENKRINPKLLRPFEKTDLKRLSVRRCCL